jgi:hypothetical protein
MKRGGIRHDKNRKEYFFCGGKDLLMLVVGQKTMSM